MNKIYKVLGLLACVSLVACSGKEEPVVETTATIANPVAGASFSVDQDIEVSLNLNKGTYGVDMAEYYANGNLIAVTDVSPFTYLAQVGNFPYGNVELKAVLRDTMNNVYTTPAVNFQITGEKLTGKESFASGIPSAVKVWNDRGEASWVACGDDGNDDSNSILTEKTTSFFSTVVEATSAAPCLEFYAKGCGMLTVSVNGTVCKSFLLSADWKPYRFVLSEGVATVRFAFKASGTNLPYAYVDDISMIATPGLEIGMYYQGGIIASLKGDHGSLLLPFDLSTNVKWGVVSDCLATGHYGAENTQRIVEKNADVYSAALLCDQLVCGGYDDWYLPSKDEMDALVGVIDQLGVLVGTYWTSSEHLGNNGGAWVQEFPQGTRSAVFKENLNAVRAMRDFVIR